MQMQKFFSFAQKNSTLVLLEHQAPKFEDLLKNLISREKVFISHNLFIHSTWIIFF